MKTFFYVIWICGVAFAGYGRAQITASENRYQDLTSSQGTTAKTENGTIPITASIYSTPFPKINSTTIAPEPGSTSVPTTVSSAVPTGTSGTPSSAASTTASAITVSPTTIPPSNQTTSSSPTDPPSSSETPSGPTQSTNATTTGIPTNTTVPTNTTLPVTTTPTPSTSAPPRPSSSWSWRSFFAGAILAISLGIFGFAGFHLYRKYKNQPGPGYQSL